MGGCCCCASRSSEATSSSTLVHYAVSEEVEPSSRNAAIPTLPGGLLVNTNLDTSTPDTYRPPPAPVPYEMDVLQYAASENLICGRKAKVISQSSDTQPAEELNPNSTIMAKIKKLDSNETAGTYDVLDSTKEFNLQKDDNLKKSDVSLLFQDEEDVCPTCLEEYNAENPKIPTKCDHHFHLSCILEWMERSNTCPVCDQEMVYTLGSAR